MNKKPRLSKSGIEYLDYVWNFCSGCENAERGICPLGKDCWATKIAERFTVHYPNGFKPTIYPEAFLSPLHLKKPSIIGCAFMGDLFGDWVDPDKKIHSVMPSGKVSISMSLKGWIFTTINQCPQHTFLFLTKCPWNLPKWSPFPDNCWVGVTATTTDMAVAGLTALSDIEAKVKYISFEPLLSHIPINANALSGIGLVIIGAMTGTKYDLMLYVDNHFGDGECLYTLMPYGNKWSLQPPIEWIEEIVRAADKAGIPVFLKENLRPLLRENVTPKRNAWALSKVNLYKGELWRQEVPK